MAASPPKRQTSDLPTDHVDGYIKLKSDKTGFFGKHTWDKLFMVSDPEILTMNLYQTQRDFFNSQPCGEISLQHMQEFTVLDKKGGKRFDLVDHTGKRFSFLVESDRDISRWVEHIMPFKDLVQPSRAPTESMSLPRAPPPQSPPRTDRQHRPRPPPPAEPHPDDVAAAAGVPAAPEDDYGALDRPQMSEYDLHAGLADGGDDDDDNDDDGSAEAEMGAEVEAAPPSKKKAYGVPMMGMSMGLMGALSGALASRERAPTTLAKQGQGSSEAPVPEYAQTSPRHHNDDAAADAAAAGDAADHAPDPQSEAPAPADAVSPPPQRKKMYAGMVAMPGFGPSAPAAVSSPPPRKKAPPQLPGSHSKEAVTQPMTVRPPSGGKPKPKPPPPSGARAKKPKPPPPSVSTNKPKPPPPSASTHKPKPPPPSASTHKPKPPPPAAAPPPAAVPTPVVVAPRKPKPPPPTAAPPQAQGHVAPRQPKPPPPTAAPPPPSTPAGAPPPAVMAKRRTKPPPPSVKPPPPTSEGSPMPHHPPAPPRPHHDEAPPMPPMPPVSPPSRMEPPASPPRPHRPSDPPSAPASAPAPSSSPSPQRVVAKKRPLLPKLQPGEDADEEVVLAAAMPLTPEPRRDSRSPSFKETHDDDDDGEPMEENSMFGSGLAVSLPAPFDEPGGEGDDVVASLAPASASVVRPSASSLQPGSAAQPVRPGAVSFSDIPPPDLLPPAPMAPPRRFSSASAESITVIPKQPSMEDGDGSAAAAAAAATGGGGDGEESSFDPSYDRMAKHLGLAELVGTSNEAKLKFCLLVAQAMVGNEENNGEHMNAQRIDAALERPKTVDDVHRMFEFLARAATAVFLAHDDTLRAMLVMALASLLRVKAELCAFYTSSNGDSVTPIRVLSHPSSVLVSHLSLPEVKHDDNDSGGGDDDVVSAAMLASSAFGTDRVTIAATVPVALMESDYCYRTALRLLASVGDGNASVMTVRVTCMLAYADFVAYFGRNHGRAQRMYNEAVRLAEMAGDDALRCALLARAMFTGYILADDTTATQYFHHLLRHYPNSNTVCMAYARFAWAHLSNYADAEKHYEMVMARGGGTNADVQEYLAYLHERVGAVTAGEEDEVPLPAIAVMVTAPAALELPPFPRPDQLPASFLEGGGSGSDHAVATADVVAWFGAHSARMAHYERERGDRHAEEGNMLESLMNHLNGGRASNDSMSSVASSRSPSAADAGASHLRTKTTAKMPVVESEGDRLVHLNQRISALSSTTKRPSTAVAAADALRMWCGRNDCRALGGQSTAMCCCGASYCDALVNACLQNKMLIVNDSLLLHRHRRERLTHLYPK